MALDSGIPRSIEGLTKQKKDKFDLDVCCNYGDDGFKEEEHPRDKGGEFTSGGGKKSEYDPSDPAARDIRTSLPVVQGTELRKVYNVANRESDRKGELGKKADTFPVEKVPIADMVATQPGLNLKIVEKYKDNPSSEKPTALYYQGKFYIGDGHHRIEAAKQRGETHIEVHVHTAGKRKPAQDIALKHFLTDRLYSKMG